MKIYISNKIVILLGIGFFALSIQSCCNQDKGNTKKLLENEIKNNEKIFSSIINQQLEFAKSKSMDFKALIPSYDSLVAINKEIDIFLSQKDWNSCNTTKIKLLRESIKSQTNIDFKFVDLSLVSHDDELFFRKLVTYDFIKTKYLINKQFLGPRYLYSYP
jgi:hypothetical protein